MSPVFEIKLTFLYFTLVIISAAFADSLPSADSTVKTPLFIFHPFLGNSSELAPIHPFDDTPSKINFQPSSICLSVRKLSTLFISGA